MKTRLKNLLVGALLWAPMALTLGAYIVEKVKNLVVSLLLAAFFWVLVWAPYVLSLIVRP